MGKEIIYLINEFNKVGVGSKSKNFFGGLKLEGR